MSNRTHNPDAIRRKLDDANRLAGQMISAHEICIRLAIGTTTLRKWQDCYGQMNAEQIERMMALQTEHRRLQRQVVQQKTDIDVLKVFGKALSPTRRRETVKRLEEELRLSQRRLCKAAGQSRSSQRYLASDRHVHATLVSRSHRLSQEHPRYGYRRITALLRREGWHVSQNTIQRIWREEGLRVVPTPIKRHRLAIGPNGGHRRWAVAKNEIWTWDLTTDKTASNETLSWLVVLDEFTRECVVLDVHATVGGSVLVNTLETAVTRRGAPRFLRSDNSPVWMVETVQEWLKKEGIESIYITPGAPWENSRIESFNARLKDELLRCETFQNLQEAREMAVYWREEYNKRRPHGALGYKTPEEFARAREEDSINDPPEST